MTRRILLPRAALNAAYRPHLFSPKRYQIYFGGASSGKSCFLATRLALDTLSGRNTLVARAVARTLRTSCWNETLKAVSRLGLSGCFKASRTDMTLTALCNGAQAIFAGLDDVEKIKSITPARGALTDVWIEEATETAFSDFKQLDKRLRGLTRHPKRMTLSFNPIARTHWLYRQFFGAWDESKPLLDAPDLTILKTTYRDNAFLTPDDRAALENESDPYYRAVYTLGEWGALGERIFTAWRAQDLSERAALCAKPLFGLDFGFASDPCACVKCALDRDQRRVYVLDEFCLRGLTTEQLAQRLRAFAGDHYVTCDSAEPRTISELRARGINALPARKGPDSLMYGIQWLRGREIIVHTACEHTKRELSLYQWKKDKDGNAIRQPQDRDNHLLDALRYALEDEMSARYALSSKRPAW